MFLINGMKAKLRLFNRTNNEEVFDDQNFQDVFIKCCPYNSDQGINFGIYTIPEATGYYQVPRWVNVKPGDQITFLGKTGEIIDEQVHTILKVYDEWYFNRVEIKILVIK